MNIDFFDALADLVREKNVSEDKLLEIIVTSLEDACKKHYGRAELANLVVDLDPKEGIFDIYLQKQVVEEVEDPLTQISLVDAKKLNAHYELGDLVRVDIPTKEFGRIVAMNAKGTILQRIREEERHALYYQYYEKEHTVVTGVVQRYVDKNVSINLGRVDAILSEKEMIRGETFYPTQRVKVYVTEVKDTSKGPLILVSRTHPELVRRLFEQEVTEVRDGIVEIRSIAREPGSRSKMAVFSNDENVDPVGACVGVNGSRVNAVVAELGGEKIDIINWDDNPALLIENALSPAKVIYVMADGDEKTAKVVVPDFQLSLAIGKEGQNARLAARLTGFKIDIESETEAREKGDLLEYESDYYDDEYYGDYGEGEYVEGEYAEGEYAEGEYAEGEYAEGEYAEEGYAGEEYAEDGYPADGDGDGDGGDGSGSGDGQA